MEIYFGLGVFLFLEQGTVLVSVNFHIVSHKNYTIPYPRFSFSSPLLVPEPVFEFACSFHLTSEIRCEGSAGVACIDHMTVKANIK